MKKLLKGFTLVEILIVIVIIGILIGALVPRMQSAQGRARDVARKNDLSQLQAAILVSYQDKGGWPAVDTAVSGINISDIETELLAAGMNGVPADPLSQSQFKGVGLSGTDGADSAVGQYRYIVVNSYGSQKGGFALMAKTEVEGGSNRVVCDNGWVPTNCASFTGETACLEGSCIWSGGSTCVAPAATKQGYIDSTLLYDVRNMKPCASLTKDPSIGTDKCVFSPGGKCRYDNESQLRYVLVN